MHGEGFALREGEGLMWVRAEGLDGTWVLEGLSDEMRVEGKYI